MGPFTSLIVFLAWCHWICIAASQAAFPSCASSCYTGLVGSSSSPTTSCNTFDYKCICQDDDYLEEQICCLYKECSDGDREAAEGYARSVCQAVGVTLGHNLTCPTISASASGTATEDAGGSTKTDTSGSFSSLDSASGNNENSNESGGDSSKTHIAHQRSQHKVKTGLGAGLGAGIPVLGAILGAIAWFLKRKKRQSAAQTPQTATTAQPPLDPAGPTYEVQHILAAPSTSFYPVPQAHPQNAAYSQPPIFEAYGSPGNLEEGRYSATKVPAAHELPVGRT